VGEKMKSILWPDKFPSEETMFMLLQKTIQKSWKNDIIVDDIKKWLNNFSGKVCNCEDEKRIALWMLCNYTYYNEDEVNHLCRSVYKELLHDIALSVSIQSDHEFTEILNKMYFASIGNASESGGLLLYYFRQQADISIDRFVYPSSVPNCEDNIDIFIDDVTLSGGTAARFFHNNIKDMKYKYVYYITLFASKDAVDKLEKLGIKVICCNLLDDRDKCFSDKSIMFFNYPSLRELAKEIAYTYGFELDNERPLGHKDGQYCFGFHYNTPNNTLPIFWSDNNWYPIFPRKEKIQNVKQRKPRFEKYL
jgi:hypothetical protein